MTSMTTYTKQEVMNASSEYFQGDDLAAKVFTEKYALCSRDGDCFYEKTPDDMHHRIAREFARIEAKKFKMPFYEDQIFNLMRGFKYIVPQGSPMFGIGNNEQIVSLSNCFLLESPIDTYSSILQTDLQLVNITKRRGGCGIDLSHLRPSEAPTTNAAKTSSGIPTWMERYSHSIREVGQNGRRGALCLTLSVHHPDIEKFCKIKLEDTKVTGANISVRLTKEFLDAVKKDKPYELRFPVDSKTPKISKMVSAKEMWNTIIHSAWLSAEPGLLMWDNVLENTPSGCYPRFAPVGVNPCLVGDTLLVTRRGLRSIEELSELTSGGDTQVFEVWDGSKWVYSTAVCTGRKKVIELTLSNGQKFRMTPDHRLGLADGTEVNAGDSLDCALDFMRPSISGLTENPELVMAGFIQGDGSYHKASNRWKYVSIGKKDEEVYNYFSYHNCVLEAPSASKPWIYGLPKDALPLLDNLLLPCKRNLRSLTYMAKSLPIDFAASFLKGLYSANGSNAGGRVTLKSSCREEIDDVQEMLTLFGIRSYVTTNKSKEVAFDNGTYTCAESYDLNITGLEDLIRFRDYIGFIHKYKMEVLCNSIAAYEEKKGHRRHITVVHIEDAGEELVYDFSMEETHWASVSGFRMHNCAELILSELDSCRLLALNLYSYVEHPFTKDAYFDFALFNAHAYMAQRLMDDLVDLESEKIDAIIAKIDSDPEPDEVKANERNMWLKIKSSNDEGRRTGTGITALGDTLAALGVKYGSDESVEVVENIYKALKLGCYRSSVDMAKELGAFVGYSADAEKTCPFIQRIQTEDPTLFADMEKYGRRNVSLLTTAPTGSLSMMTQTSSGIEPVFKLAYTRRKKVNNKTDKVAFVDKSGDMWEEFEVLHPKLQVWQQVTGETDITKSPWYGACAEDIDWVKRVEIQAAAQRHVCHSISSTVNLPENVDEATVAKIYETAFDKGCKGITVYRNGCRSGVLIDTKKPEAPKPEFVKPMHMPEIMSALRIKQMTPFGQMHVKIVIDPVTGREREVFATLGKGGDVAGSDLEAICRLMSMYLRVDGSLKDVVRQLDGIGSNLSIPTKDGRIASLADAIAKAIKKYQLLRKQCGLEAILLGTADYSLLKKGLKEVEKPKTEAYSIVCPECGGALSKSEGCIKCPGCGYSKC